VAIEWRATAANVGGVKTGAGTLGARAAAAAAVLHVTVLARACSASFIEYRKMVMKEMRGCEWDITRHNPAGLFGQVVEARALALWHATLHPDESG
jgi:hypothetical protein